MDYAVLLYGDETRWDRAEPAERTAAYADHTEFARLLTEGGHEIIGGAELRPTRQAKTVRGTSDEFTVTDGPFAETAEQLGGFYLVRTDNPDDLYRLVAMLSGGEPIEVRPVVPGEEQV